MNLQFAIVPRRLLVAGGDGTKLLDLGEEVLDQMARAAKLSVIVSRRGPVGSRRNGRGLARGRKRLKHANIGVERPPLSRGQALSAISVSASIVGSSWSAPTRSCASPPVRKKSIGLRQRIDQSVDLGAQSAARAPGRLVLAVSSWAPALCWWACTTVLSIIAYSLSASAARC